MLKTETYTTIVYTVVCDECGVEGPEAWSATKANEKAIKQGWFVLENGDHFCPEHKETEKALRSYIYSWEVTLDSLKRQHRPIADDE